MLPKKLECSLFPLLGMFCNQSCYNRGKGFFYSPCAICYKNVILTAFNSTYNFFCSTCNVHSSKLVRNEESWRRKTSVGEDYSPSIVHRGAEEAFTSRRGRMWTQGLGRKVSTPTGDESRKSVISPGKYKTEVNINHNMLGLYSLENITFIYVYY